MSTLGPKMVTLKPGAMTRTGSAAERERAREREGKADIIAAGNRARESEGQREAGSARDWESVTQIANK